MLQPRTNSSADARQRARSSCFHSSKRPQKGWRNAFGRFGDDVSTATEALDPQKGNITSIIRHEIRKISDEDRGRRSACTQILEFDELAAPSSRRFRLGALADDAGFKPGENGAETKGRQGRSAYPNDRAVYVSGPTGKLPSLVMAI